MTTFDTGPNGAMLTEGIAATAKPLIAAPADMQPEAPESDSGVPRRWRWWRAWGQRLQAREPARDVITQVEDRDDAIRILALVRRSRKYAVWLTAGIATVSFVLSFTALQELAAMTAWPGWRSWLLPLIIDGLIVLATLGIVALAPYRAQRPNWVYFWCVLVAAALVSIGGNALHAWLATDELVPWMRYGSAGLACVAPIALLASTHILAILWRFNPTPPADAASQLRAGAVAIAVERDDKWNAVAARMHEDGYCRNQPTAKIAVVLRYLYDHQPTMSLRQIGAQPEVDLHHDWVRKIRDGAGAVLASASVGDR